MPSNFPSGVLTDTVTTAVDGAAISVVNSAAIDLTIAAGTAETNTLPAPTFRGQTMSIYAAVVGGGGTRAITVNAAFNQAGDTIITFQTLRDWVQLVAILKGGTTAWALVTNDGATLS